MTQIRSACWIGVFGILLVPPLTAAQPPTDEETGLPLRSIVQREGDVFASTDAGLFRGDRATRRWTRLALPADMPPGGAFARMPDDSDALLYVGTRRNMYRFPTVDPDDFRYGIYSSRDDGESWELLAEGDDYGPVLLHANGSLFAVSNARNHNGPPRLHLSADMGKHWRDISEGLFGQVISIFPDPDHPDLICLDVNSIRGYILRAEDEHYRWQAIRAGDWYPQRYFFHRSYGGSPYYVLPASLDNYFENDFGDNTELPAYDLASDKPRFTFGAGQAVVVPVTIRFRENMAVRRQYWQQHGQGQGDAEPTPRTVKLIDHPDAVDLWGIQVERGDQRERVSPPALGADRAQLRSRREWRTIPVSAAQPYRRVVILDELYDFSEPGVYHVQLVYENGPLAYPDHGEWISFTSPVFEVTITGEDGDADK